MICSATVLICLGHIVKFVFVSVVKWHVYLLVSYVY